MGIFYWRLLFSASDRHFYVYIFYTKLLKKPISWAKRWFSWYFLCIFTREGLWLAHAIIYLSQTYFKKEQFQMSIIYEIWWYTQVTNCSCAFGNFDSSMERISRSLTALQKNLLRLSVSRTTFFLLCLKIRGKKWCWILDNTIRSRVKMLQLPKKS